MIARNVPSSMTPLPQESLGFWKEFGQQAVFRRSENSGLATGKKYRHKQQRYRGLGIRMKNAGSANTEKITTAISKTFVPIVTERLLKRSAK